MNHVKFRPAGDEDVERLLGLMRALHAEDGYSFDPLDRWSPPLPPAHGLPSSM